MALILDTGPVVALIDCSDPDHDRCLELISASTETRIVPLLTLVEIEYHLRPWSGGFAGLMTDIELGRLAVHTPQARELSRAAALVKEYSDLSLGLVDASVVACTETLREPKLATLDHRPFDVVAPRHVERLRLLPG